MMVMGISIVVLSILLLISQMSSGMCRWR